MFLNVYIDDIFYILSHNSVDINNSGWETTGFLWRRIVLATPPKNVARYSYFYAIILKFSY